MSKLPELKVLADAVHTEVHETPDIIHGFDSDDVMNAAVLLHALVMDVGAAYLLDRMPEEDAVMYSRMWGEEIHNQILRMTGVDTHLFKDPLKPQINETA